VELTASALQASLERLRAPLHRRDPSLFLREPLVLDCEDQPARDDRSDVDVDAVVPVRLVFPKNSAPAISSPKCIGTQRQLSYPAVTMTQSPAKA
jgi:hypothetical protein